MESMIFILAIFVIVFAIFSMIITIRKLREEVHRLQEENKSLREENHLRHCSEQSLLWQRENLRNEIIRLLNDGHYYYDVKDQISTNFRNVEVYKKGRQIMSFDDAWIIAIKMIYNWS